MDVGELASLGKAFGRIFRREKESKLVEEKTSEDLQATHNVVYLKALPLRSLADVEVVKREVKSGNIMIVKVSPLARKSIEDVKKAVNELCELTEEVGGDIARLGEERVVVCPSGIKIWREPQRSPVGG